MNDIYTDIYEKLSTLQWLMRRHQMYCQAEAGTFADTARGQGRILAMLKIQPEIATKELAYLLGIRQQSLNELLNKMEKKGYVERKPSENDRRVMIVHLTEKGKEIQQPESDYHEIFDCLLPDELQQMCQYLDRIIETFRAQYKNEQEEDSIADRMSRARERMGEQQFEQLMLMRKRAFGNAGMPRDIPSAERFSKDYDGFVPDRGDFPPFDFDKRK